MRVPDQPWMVKVKQELVHAQEARSAGNEGRARVCARRAANLILGEYLRRTGRRTYQNVMEQLSSLGDLAGLPDRAAAIIPHISQRVDQEHQLPAGIDLIEDAIHLIDALSLNQS